MTTKRPHDEPRSALDLMEEIDRKLDRAAAICSSLGFDEDLQKPHLDVIAAIEDLIREAHEAADALWKQPTKKL